MAKGGLKKTVASAEAIYREAWFARINWRAHVIPIAGRCFEEFCRELSNNEFKGHWGTLSEDFAKGHFNDQKEEVWADSITLSFGNRALSGQPVIPVKGRTRVLSERQATFVLSQALSGHVVALIYPPRSEMVGSEQPFYMMDAWNNPTDITRSCLMKLLYKTFEVDLVCSAAIFPNRRADRLLACLKAKDEVLRNGGSRIWVWLKYVFFATRGVLKLYGIGKPAP